MNEAKVGLLRALIAHDSWDYPPTTVELLASYDAGSISMEKIPSRSELSATLEQLREENIITTCLGRWTFTNRVVLIGEHAMREALFPRKLRKARRVVQWLRHIGGLRFVALCNTTALAHARDAGDLDFFIIVKQGTLWQSRLWSVLPFKLFSDRPSPTRIRKDAACFSFFIDDHALDLAPLASRENDPCFRHWFFSFLPLLDDGISASFWRANATLRARHPYAEAWRVNPDITCRPSFFSLPCPTFFDPLARKAQEAAFPEAIKCQMNQGNHDVVVGDHVLKFHVEDGRRSFFERYKVRCHQYEVEP